MRVILRGVVCAVMICDWCGGGWGFSTMQMRLTSFCKVLGSIWKLPPVTKSLAEPENCIVYQARSLWVTPMQANCGDGGYVPAPIFTPHTRFMAIGRVYT